MIKILFIYHGRMLRSFEKACKINGFKERESVCYTTTTLFGEEL